MIWARAVWEWFRELYRQRKAIWQVQQQEQRRVLQVRLPLTFPAWIATPLQPWLRWWGLVMASVLLGLGIAASVWGAVMFLAVGPNGSYPDGSFAYAVVAALPLMVLGGLQLTFFLRSARRGAIGITLILVLLASYFGVRMVGELELVLLLSLWLTGGSAAPSPPHKDT